jgi:molybdenum cofactor cytidylyltransferase
MGQPKALLAWQDTTLLGYCLRELRAADVAHRVVVLGANAGAILATLADSSDVKVAYNLEVATGRSASIRIGAARVPDTCDAVLVQSVDQPCPRSVIDALFEAIRKDSADTVAVPTFQGRRGHPVCVSGSLLGQLRGLREQTQGLRAVVRGAARVLEVAVDTESVCWNLNDPAAYAAALVAMGGR